MATANSSVSQAQIGLLFDQAQDLIDERNRALQINLEPLASDDKELNRALGNLMESIQVFQVDKKVISDNKKREALAQEYAQRYRDLLEQYKTDPKVSVDHLDLNLTPIQNKKHVRFRDERLVEVDDSNSSSRPYDPREELFVTPYKDDPDDSYRDNTNQSSTSPKPDMTNNQHLKQQQLVFQEQDEHLDRLASSVSRQHRLSLHISDELDSHLELLDELDDLTDRSQNRLATARQRLTKFTRKAKDNGSILTIAILFIIFIILLIVLK